MKSFFIIVVMILHLPLTFALNLELDTNKWQTVTYSKIPSNKITNVNNSLKVTVNSSSSALVFPFKKTTHIESLFIKARVEGDINYSGLEPGNEGADDFPLRVGLILKGENTLNFFQKALAPKWLVELDTLAKEKGGFDKIHSFIFYTTPPTFKSREHPLSSHFYESVAAPFKNSKIEYTTPLNLKDVIGIWMSADGDDTKSSFTVTIDKIEILESSSE
ncbi:hypothetical protein [Halobacteriovorax sp.]|uniref:hypothetical protein n=1 Tax=Halobacteriovorax sp. TaxID=2020862 RepID=UPI0035651351